MELLLALFCIIAILSVLFFVMDLYDDSVKDRQMFFTFGIVIAFTTITTIFFSQEKTYEYIPLTTVEVNGKPYKGYMRDTRFVFAPNPQEAYDYVGITYPRKGSLEDTEYIFIPAKDTINYPTTIN